MSDAPESCVNCGAQNVEMVAKAGRQWCFDAYACRRRASRPQAGEPRPGEPSGYDVSPRPLEDERDVARAKDYAIRWGLGETRMVSLLETFRAVRDEAIVDERRRALHMGQPEPCPHTTSLDSLPPICGQCGEIDPWSKRQRPNEAQSPIWRVGRSLGRTLYMNEKCVGIVDTVEIAEALVSAANSFLDSTVARREQRTEPAATEMPKPGEYAAPDSPSDEPCGACGAFGSESPRGRYGNRTACLNGRACLLRQGWAPPEPRRERAQELPWANVLCLALEKAIAKHPSGPDGMRSLVEEVGEVASAMRRESTDRVRAELIDVAVVAIRWWEQLGRTPSSSKGREE